MKSYRKNLLPFAILLLSLHLPAASVQAASGTAPSCAVLADNILAAHAVYQNNHTETLTFLQDFTARCKEDLQGRQRLVEQQQKNLAAMRQQMETVKKLTIQEGSREEDVARYNAMVQESLLLNAEFGKMVAHHNFLMAELNTIIGIYNNLVSMDPSEIGCGDYLPRIAATSLAAAHRFDTQKAVTLCAEENMAITELARVRSEIENSFCIELINSLPGFPRPKLTDLPSLPILPAPEDKKTLREPIIIEPNLQLPTETAQPVPTPTETDSNAQPQEKAPPPSPQKPASDQFLIPDSRGPLRP